MSLINQMLQDLEKRQPVGKTLPSYPQVLAVPTPTRIHPAWWAIPLILIGAGVLAWRIGLHPSATKAVENKPLSVIRTHPYALRPQPAVVARVVTDIPATQPMAATPPIAVPLPMHTPSVAAVQSASQPKKVVTIVLPDSPLAARVSDSPTPVHAEAQIKPDRTARSASESPIPDRPSASNKTDAHTEKTVSAPGVPTNTSNALAGAITKHVKELTPQQQAENEYRKALGFLQQGRVKEAVEGLNHVLELDPRHMAARQTVVGVLVEANRYDDAERKLQEGLAISPEQPELVMMLARLQVARGDVRSALANLERAQSNAPDNAAYQAFLAALLQRDGRHREAIEHYLLALHNAPQSGVWLMGLGISLQAENRLSEAREAFNRARTSNTLSAELQGFVEQRLKQLGAS